MKYVKRAFVVIVLVSLSYFFLGELFLPKDTIQYDLQQYEFNDNWVRLNEDGSKEAFSVPGNYEKRIVLENTLPRDWSKNYSCIAFRGEKTEIYIDGVLRKAYENGTTRLFGHDTTEVYVMVGLTPEDAGKTITVKIEGLSGVMNPIYIGNEMGIWYSVFQKYGFELIVATFTLFLSIICIIGSHILQITYKQEVPLKYLGWCISLAALWIICNSACRELVFPNMAVVSDISYIMILSIPLPIIIYMNRLQNGRYELVHRIVGIWCTADYVLCVGMRILDIKTFHESFGVIAIGSFSVILGLGITIICDVFKGYVREYRYVAIGVLGVILTAGIQVVSYFYRTDIFSGLVLSVGMLFLLLFSVIHTVLDISNMEKEKRKAMISNELKGKFLANMSHEIRTPINGILGMDEMILRESTEPVIREYAMDIHSAGQSLLSIVNDILDFSKIESGKMELVLVEYDFSSMLHDIMNMIRGKAEGKGLQLNLQIDEQLPSRLYGDDVRIRQILVNILNNAVKYTQKGSVDFSVWGEPAEEPQMVLLHFEVRDTGIGIKEEDIHKLFEEFERIEEKRNRNIEGTGLGMSITMQLLRLMDSQLCVESEYGKGSCFSFVLRQKVICEDAIGNLQKRIEEQRMQYSHAITFMAPEARVLVVDDNAVNRKVFKHLLKDNQLIIDEADSGKACLELVQNHAYDMIFLDHMMPEMDGIETRRALEQLSGNQSKAAVIVALTANAIAGAKEMYLEEGFDAFLSKPIVPEKLEKMLMQYLPEEKVHILEEDEISVVGMRLANENASTDAPENEEKAILSRLAEWSELNLDYARLLNKSDSMLFEVLQDFYHMMEPEETSLQQSYEQICSTKEGTTEHKEALKQYCMQAHTVKSSAAMIGAMNISGVAKLLEYAARNEDSTTIKKLHDIFMKNWRQMYDVLKKEFGNFTALENAVAGRAYVPSEFEELLKRLQAAMEEMDIDVADELITELGEFDLDAKWKEGVISLQQAVMNMDTNQVMEEVEAFLEKIHTANK